MTENYNPLANQIEECISGIKIILQNHFPMEIINKETGEVEDVNHMVQES